MIGVMQIMGQTGISHIAIFSTPQHHQWTLHLLIMEQFKHIMTGNKVYLHLFPTTDLQK
jgi:hypothetical protein